MKPDNGVGLLSKHSQRNQGLRKDQLYSIQYSQYATKFTNDSIKVKIIFCIMKVNIHICRELNVFHDISLKNHKQ
jgi:hypothetical protein